MPFDLPPPAATQVHEQVVERPQLKPFRLALSDSSGSTPFEPAPSDLLRFGGLWGTIRETAEQKQLFPLIAKRRAEIKDLKEHWRLSIDTLSPFYQDIQSTFQSGRLEVIQEGGGSAYLLLDQHNHPRFVVKPVDEDLLCLNNYKYNASPYTHILVRSGIPLYRSAQTDVLAYEIAEVMGIGHITPKTVMGIFSYSGFYDITDPLEPAFQAQVRTEAGAVDKEKLCSIQIYLENSDDLYSAINEWGNQGVSAEDVGTLIDQDNFEEIILFIWVIYDTDAHAGNIRVFPEKENKYLLRKIDNGLSLPDINHSLLNAFGHFPNAEKPLSARARQLIRDIPLDLIEKKMFRYDMQDAIPALKERVSVLQQLAQREDLTISSIDLRMRALQLENGTSLALSPLSHAELTALINP